MSDDTTEDKRDHARAVAEAVDAVFRSRIRVPDGHVYEFDVKGETSWLLGGPGQSLSAFVRGASADPGDPDQVRVELRVFLDHPRAMVFARQGPPIEGESRILVSNPHSHAVDYTQLACDLSDRVNEAIESVIKPDVERDPDAEHNDTRPAPGT